MKDNLNKMSLDNREINSIVAYTYEMLKKQKKSTKTFSSRNMLDNIWNNFDEKKNSKDDQNLNYQNQTNLKKNLHNRLKDKAVYGNKFPNDDYLPNPSLVYITGNSEFYPNQEYEIYNPVYENDKNYEQENLSFQENSNKWKITSKSIKKTSSLAKSSSNNLDSSSSSTRTTNRRNLVMGLGDEKKKEEVNLNSLINHLENNEGDIDMILPEGLNFRLKNSKGKILKNVTAKRPKKKENLIDRKQWKIGNKIIERTKPIKPEGSSDKYIAINYDVKTVS